MTDYRYAGFWRRMVAYFIDLTILFFISILLLLLGWIAFLLGSPVGGRALMQHMKQLAPLFVFFYNVSMILLNMLYFTYFHGNTGQTPGKILVGVQVRQVNGERMTYSIAFLRWAGYIVSVIFLYLGFLWIGVDRRKRGWHDYIAGTIAVRLDSISDCAFRPAIDRHELNAAAVEAHGS